MEKKLSSPFFYLAPIFLTLALIFTHQIKNCYDLYFVVPVSILLLSIAPKKGFFLSSFLLIVGSLVSHLFFSPPLFFKMMLDFSVLLSFFLLWQVEEERRGSQEELKTLLSSKESFIGHLEEEMRFQKEEELENKLTLQTKIEELQKNIEEVEKEKGALEILNDVLRTNQKEAFLQEKELVQELVSAKTVLDEFTLLYQQVEEEKEEATYLLDKASFLIEDLGSDLIEKEKEIEEQEILIRNIMKEPSSSHLSSNLREAFSPKNRPLLTKGPSLEETLREALLSKKKKK